MVTIAEYIDRTGRCRFREWFDGLDAAVAAKVVTAQARLQNGNKGNVKSVGEGVSEYRIDYGPGYRVYFGEDGPSLVLLLSGGSKKQQQSDIAQAKTLWRDYKDRKRAAAKAASAPAKRGRGRDKRR